MNKYHLLIIFVFGFLGVYGQTDIENSQDYYLLGRMQNYYIEKYDELEFGDHKFYIEGKYISKEGKKYTIKYRHNKSKYRDFEFPTRLQLLRNYSNAIIKVGGEVMFERYNSEHGYYTFKHNNKNIWLQVKTASNGSYYSIHIIEQEPMRQDIVVNAELIKNKIELEGKIAIYGIYFDVGKSTIKDESEPSLNQISKYLKDNPSINCWVVGHTDSDGSFELNSKLSLERATAIKKYLEQRHHIESDRLFAEGVGPLAPIATNNTKEGKKLNRRVELVRK